MLAPELSCWCHAGAIDGGVLFLCRLWSNVAWCFQRNCWTVDPGAWSLTMDGTPKWMLIMLVAGKALGWLVDPLGRNPEAGALLPVFCDG
ncbi:hypothetical protein Nepgr_025380 [Nepenthes gracilis]|uniref:Uncharacterized protein n=1 Tax=Nepenthes gracilis TaxID=150966 RepID=A0AAD3T7K3_NEPGR|nr:hypothetical protein Nepgr_025380 [Nepenthes gracilis]